MLSFPPATEIFQFAGFASYAYGFSARYHNTCGGLPHSEIRGSTGAHASARLIAVCHVLHRLSTPRHPPDALHSLARSSTKPDRHPPSPKEDENATTAPRAEASSIPPVRRHRTPEPAAPFGTPCPSDRRRRPRHVENPLHDVQRPTEPHARPGSPFPSRRTNRHGTDRSSTAGAPAIAAEAAPRARRWWAWADLNSRPHAYQACALTN